MHDETSQDNHAVLAWTVLAHPDPARIGGQATFPVGQRHAISRIETCFDSHPLHDPYMSRTPMRITTNEDGSLNVLPRKEMPRLTIDGVPSPAGGVVHPSRLVRGFTVGMAGRVLLHGRVRQLCTTTRMGLYGVSPELDEVRRQVATTQHDLLPILVRGENGTCRTEVAMAVHAAGRRTHIPWIIVGKGPSQPGDKDRWVHGATMFVEEMREIPASLHPAMVTAATSIGRDEDTGIRWLGATSEEELEDSLWPEICRRSDTVTITVPPLRARREDVPIRLVALLRHELRMMGAAARLAPSRVDQPWLGVELIEDLIKRPWFGNDRELGKVARLIAQGSYDKDQACLPVDLSWGPQPAQRIRHQGAPSVEAPRVLRSEEMRDALRRSAYSLDGAAQALAIPPTTLLKAMRRAGIQQAEDVDERSLLAALASHGGDLDKVARALEVSRDGLVERMEALDLLETS